MARSHRVSSQAWLLWSLKEAIASELVPGSGTLAWYIPVNMHGAFPGQQRRNANFSLEVRFPLEATPDDVQKAIRRELRLRRHWVVAKATYALSWMARPWILRLAVRMVMRQPPWQGSFNTSLATSAESLGLEKVDEWGIGLTPVVKTSPLGASGLEWQGLMSLSIQIHPSLSDDPQVARDWLAAWRRIAMSTVAPALPAPAAVGDPSRDSPKDAAPAS